MKTNTTIIPIMIIVTIMSACCHKKDCVDQSRIMEIQFQNFTKEEIDTFLITRFIRSSNFINKTDSFYVYASEYNSNMSIEPKFIVFPSEVNVSENDFEVKLISTQDKYQVSNFVLIKDICNNCFPVSTDFYNKVESYNLNGTTMIPKGWTVTITK